MGRHPVSADRGADAAELRSELLDRLGLTANASDQEVETAHDGLVEFLELAPREVRSWAAARARDVDEAFARLSGSAQDLAAAAGRLTAAQESQGETSRGPAGPSPSATRGPRRTQATWVILPLLVVAVVLGVYYLGRGSPVPGISGTPTNQASATAAAGSAPVALDQAKVAALMKKVGADPKDVASLQALGDIYFASADYRTATVWEQKVLAIDSKNQVALLALGAAQFNQGNKAEAKEQWLVAAALYPNLAEVHYDLGFLYLSQDPPDMAKVTAEWNKVIEIDPSSKVAKTVATHLKSLRSPSPDTSVTPSTK